jgi:uncharacterized protein (UPF0248 family)
VERAYNRSVATVRELLNRLRWDAGSRPDGVVIEVRARKAGEERVEPVPFESVIEVLPAGVVVAGGVFLPYHRFVRIRRGGELLWPPAAEVRA